MKQTDDLFETTMRRSTAFSRTTTELAVANQYGKVSKSVVLKHLNPEFRKQYLESITPNLQKIVKEDQEARKEEERELRQKKKKALFEVIKSTTDYTTTNLVRLLKKKGYGIGAPRLIEFLNEFAESGRIRLKVKSVPRFIRVIRTSLD